MRERINEANLSVFNEDKSGLPEIIRDSIYSVLILASILIFIDLGLGLIATPLGFYIVK